MSAGDSSSLRLEEEGESQQIPEPTIERFRRVPINIYPENAPTEAAVEESDSLSIPAPENELPVQGENHLSDSDSEHEDTTTELLLEDVLPSRQSKVMSCIITDLYNEIESFEDESYGESCCESCTDSCFQCFSYSPCSRCHGGSTKLTTSLRRARNKGWKILGKIAFPLFSGFLSESVSNIVRYAWVFLDMILVVIGICVSGATFPLEHNRAFNITHLCLSLVSSFLAIADFLCILAQSRVCCGRSKRLDKPDNAESRSHWCLRLKNASDTARMIVSEMLIYPLFICSIFTLATGRDYEGETTFAHFGFALYVISCLSLIGYNYLIRLLVLAGIIKGVKEVRTPSTEMLKKFDSYNPSTIHSASSYLIYFFIHVVLQMLVQVFVIFAVGAKIWYENSDFELPADVDTYSGNISALAVVQDPTIHASGYLIIMISVGYVFPFLGLLSFFVVTYYWSQEFPIGLCIDLISIWKSGSKDDVLEIRKNFAVRKEVVQKTVDQFFKMETLVNEFKQFRGVSFFSKFLYPFKSPLPVIFCISYLILLVMFVFCAAIINDEMGIPVIHVLDGGKWVIFFIVACTTWAIANIYVIAVAVVWIIVIFIVIPCLLCRPRHDQNVKFDRPWFANMPPSVCCAVPYIVVIAGVILLLVYCIEVLGMFRVV